MVEALTSDRQRFAAHGVSHGTVFSDRRGNFGAGRHWDEARRAPLARGVGACTTADVGCALGPHVHADAVQFVRHNIPVE